MTSPLVSSLAKQVSAGLKSTFLDATFSRSVATAGSEEWNPGVVTTTDYACKAIVGKWSAYLLAGGMVNAEDARVVILAQTLAVRPQPGDKITIRNETFQIVPAGVGKPPVETDPAQAAWVVRAKSVGHGETFIAGLVHFDQPQYSGYVAALGA